MIPLFCLTRRDKLAPLIGIAQGTGRPLGELGLRDALQALEFLPAREEMRDFVACRFQLRLQLENLRARFRIKIRRGKSRLQIRHGSRPDLKMNHVR